MEKQLIKKVKENDVIYNAHSTHYRDTEMRQRTWEKIGKELNIKPEEAKSTWDKLRRCFVNASNRRRSKENERGIVIHPWKYEKDMAFLWPFVERNRRTADYHKSENNKTSSDSESETYDTMLNPEITTDSAENIKTEIEDMQECPSPTASFMYNIGKLEMSTTYSENGTNKRDYPNEYDSEDNKHSSKKKRIQHQQPEMDACDMFFMSMSKMTKSLPDLDQAKIKLAVGNIVLQGVIDLHETRNSTIGSENNDIDNK